MQADCRKLARLLVRSSYHSLLTPILINKVDLGLMYMTFSVEIINNMIVNANVGQNTAD